MRQVKSHFWHQIVANINYGAAKKMPIKRESVTLIFNWQHSKIIIQKLTESETNSAWTAFKLRENTKEYEH